MSCGRYTKLEVIETPSLWYTWFVNHFNGDDASEEMLERMTRYGMTRQPSRFGLSLGSPVEWRERWLAPSTERLAITATASTEPASTESMSRAGQPLHRKR